jgi:hypothetical protein
MQKKFEGKNMKSINFYNTMDFDTLEKEIKLAVTSNDRCIAICGGDGYLNLFHNNPLELLI